MRPNDVHAVRYILLNQFALSRYCSFVVLKRFFRVSVARFATTGNSNCSWSVVDAAELSLARDVAEGSGESLGANFKAPPRFPAVAHNRSDPRVPYWHSTTLTEGNLNYHHL